MSNYLDAGNLVEVTAPYAVTAGQGVLVGALFGVAQNTAASGAPVVIHTAGVHVATKDPTQAMTVGQRLFWDNTNRRLTTTATGNFHVGLCYRAAAASDATVAVNLSHRVPPSGS